MHSGKRLTPREAFVRDNWRKKTVAEIAAEAGLSANCIYKTAAKLGLPTQSSLREEDEWPSEAEIKERAAEVRRGWSAEEEAHRLGGRPEGYSLPCYTVRQIFPAFQARGA